jgi:hypothetical protein
MHSTGRSSSWANLSLPRTYPHPERTYRDPEQMDRSPPRKSIVILNQSIVLLSEMTDLLYPSQERNQLYPPQTGVPHSWRSHGMGIRAKHEPISPHRRMNRMDRVRFGRALGMGARAAARTAFEAVDAATAPSPTPRSSSQTAQTRSTTSAPTPSPRPAQSRPTVMPPLRTAAQVLPAARAAAAGIGAPFRKATRALWHEITGSFFALFAFSFGLGIWHARASAVSPIVNDRYHFYAFCTFTVVFAYFSISSFLRARSKD